MITQSQVVYISGVTLAGLAALAYLNRQQPPPPSDPLLKFTSENITQRFTAALPEICPVLNLELAVCKQVETFTQTEELRTFWGLVNLGTNVVQISVVPMKFLTMADRIGIVERELFAQTYKNYGLATIRDPVLEVLAKLESFENGCGFLLRVLRAGKPRPKQN